MYVYYLCQPVVFFLSNCCIVGISKTRSVSVRMPTNTTCGHGRLPPQSQSSVPNNWRKRKRRLGIILSLVSRVCVCVRACVHVCVCVHERLHAGLHAHIKYEERSDHLDVIPSIVNDMCVRVHRACMCVHACMSVCVLPLRRR